MTRVRAGAPHAQEIVAIDDDVVQAVPLVHALRQAPLSAKEFEIDWDAHVTETQTSTIRKGVWTARGREIVCIKEYKTRGDERTALSLLKQERDALASVVHENVVRVYGWLTRPLCLVME